MIRYQTADVEPIGDSPLLVAEARSLKGLGRIRHGFFGRTGGVSEGPYATLNVGTRSADSADKIAINRGRVAQRMGFAADSLVTARQVHGIRCLKVDTTWSDSDAPEADALTTRREGLLIGALTADCAPILLADPVAGVVGAVHAGWRGAMAGVIEAAVLAVAEQGGRAGRLVAAVGPCIGQPSYEVGPEFEAAVIANDKAAARFFAVSQADGRPHFDLAGYCGWRLERLGVAWVEILGRDTCAEPQAFFSHRRSIKTADPRHGLQVGVIGIAAS